MCALIVRSVVFYILYVDGPPTHPGQYLWHRLPYATSRPRLAYRRYLSFSVCMCFCLLADVNLDQTAQKGPFLDTKSAIEQARRLKQARNLVVVMRACSLVVLSYLDAGLEPRCGRRDFLTAWCCLRPLAASCSCCC